jgi:hypothetical protein
MSLNEFYDNGPKTWAEAFPPICVTPRYDPTLVTNHILPTFHQSMVYDPRPDTRICYSYKSLTQKNPKQEEITDVMPPGGAAGRGFPYGAYVQNIDRESDIYRLGEPLTKCAEKRYIPVNHVAPKSISDRDVPGAKFDNSTTLSPLLTTITKEAGCRNADDQEAWNRSSRLFFNPTKYDRTSMVPKDLKQAESRLDG